MQKEKCIEVLKSLKDYVGENWDESEYGQEIQKAQEAVDMAVAIIESSNVCGALILNGETFIVFKQDD